MKLRFILAIFILLLACGLQFWFASVDVFINFILTALIVFAFYFDLWEVAVFVLFGIFVINWQPEISLEVVLFAVIPLAAYTFDKIFAWSFWAAIPTAIFAGLLAFYFAIAPRQFFPHWQSFVVDLAGSLFFGALLYGALNKADE